MVIGSPEDIDAIAGALENYLNVIEEETGQFSAAFAQYGESWQDRERQAFEACFQDLLAMQSRFLEEAARQIPELRMMADHLRAYQRR